MPAAGGPYCLLKARAAGTVETRYSSEIYTHAAQPWQKTLFLPFIDLVHFLSGNIMMAHEIPKMNVSNHFDLPQTDMWPRLPSWTLLSRWDPGGEMEPLGR